MRVTFMQYDLGYFDAPRRSFPDHARSEHATARMPRNILATERHNGRWRYLVLAVLVGAYIPLISLPLGVILLVAAVTVHLPYGFSSIKLRAVTAAGPQFGPPGYETDLLYVAALATLVLGGSGPFALDRWLPGLRRSGRPKNQ
jgi:hypothetical protein